MMADVCTPHLPFVHRTYGRRGFGHPSLLTILLLMNRRKPPLYPDVPKEFPARPVRRALLRIVAQKVVSGAHSQLGFICFKSYAILFGVEERLKLTA